MPFPASIRADPTGGDGRDGPVVTNLRIFGDHFSARKWARGSHLLAMSDKPHAAELVESGCNRSNVADESSGLLSAHAATSTSVGASPRSQGQTTSRRTHKYEGHGEPPPSERAIAVREATGPRITGAQAAELQLDLVKIRKGAPPYSLPSPDYVQRYRKFKAKGAAQNGEDLEGTVVEPAPRPRITICQVCFLTLLFLFLTAMFVGAVYLDTDGFGRGIPAIVQKYVSMVGLDNDESTLDAAAQTVAADDDSLHGDTNSSAHD